VIKDDGWFGVHEDGLARRSKQPLILKESPVDTMADQRTMAELLCAPTEGYVESIVVPSILDEHFKLKHSLINMMTSDQFFGLKKDNPHDHIRVARHWLEKEPSRSILTWEDLVSKFMNEFCPLSRTTNLRNEISKFQQRFDESFHEAWDRYKDLLRAYHHHGFTELHQLDTFYNSLNLADQDSLNSAVGGNLLERRTQVVLTIIENKSKKIKKMIEINIKGMQTQINNVKNKLRNEMKTLIQASMSNQTNELKNMMASFFQMNTASTSGLGPLPSNTISNPKGELKAITTRSGLVLDGPFIPMPPPFINLEEDELVEETLTDPELGEYTTKEFADELALIPFPLGKDDLPFDIESDLREIEYLLNLDPTKEIDSIVKDLVDEDNLADPKNNLVDTSSKMFIDEHTLDYSSPPLYDNFDDDLLKLEFDDDNVYNDPFDFKEDKIKESKLLIDELDPPRSSDFLPSPNMTRFSLRIFPRLMLCLPPITRTKYLI
nr:reverse transcriptase domain-containing protein [Tanacetum cinerariifolium]